MRLPQDGGQDKGSIKGGATRSKAILLSPKKSILFHYSSHPLTGASGNELENGAADSNRPVLCGGRCVTPFV